MKTSRFLLFSLLTSVGILASASGQARTIFERYAPPLLPLPVPVPVPVAPGYVHGPDIWVSPQPESVWHDDYRHDDRRYWRPGHHHHGWHDDDRGWHRDRSYRR